MHFPPMSMEERRGLRVGDTTSSRPRDRGLLRSRLRGRRGDRAAHDCRRTRRPARRRPRSDPADSLPVGAPVRPAARTLGPVRRDPRRLEQVRVTVAVPANDAPAGQVFPLVAAMDLDGGGFPDVFTPPPEMRIQRFGPESGGIVEPDWRHSRHRILLGETTEPAHSAAPVTRGGRRAPGGRPPRDGAPTPPS